MTIDIGINDSDRQEIAHGLSKLLADSYVLYLQTQNFHWNVTGPMFQTLHLMFEEQYTELALAIDEIAERIRALGLPAPGSFKAYMELASIQEATVLPNAEGMIEKQVQAHETVIRTARSIFDATDKANDEPTADLLTQRLQVHEKFAWMMRALLES